MGGTQIPKSAPVSRLQERFPLSRGDLGHKRRRLGECPGCPAHFTCPANWRFHAWMLHISWGVGSGLGVAIVPPPSWSRQFGGCTSGAPLLIVVFCQNHVLYTRNSIQQGLETMSSSHLDRTGFRHLVMGIATITTLIGAMWASSSFLGPISGKSLASTPTLDDTYSRISHYTIPIIVLNSSAAFIIVVMSLIVDWHFDIPLPAYMEFVWVGVVWCIQLVSTIITASVASPSALCRTNDLAPSETWSMGALCSNWKAVLASSVIALAALTLHLSWHLLFRLCHRTTLANRPTTPVNLWTTPLPRKYPINPYERGQRRLLKTSIALGKARIPPADSCASTPVAAHTTYSRSEEVTRGYARPAAAARVSVDDLEKAITSDNASIASSKVGRMTPPGLDIAAESRRSRATEN